MFTHNAHHLYNNAVKNTTEGVKRAIVQEVHKAFKEGGNEPLNQHQIKSIVGRAVLSQ